MLYALAALAKEIKIGVESLTPGIMPHQKLVSEFQLASADTSCCLIHCNTALRRYCTRAFAPPGFLLYAGPMTEPPARHRRKVAQLTPISSAASVADIQSVKIRFPIRVSLLDHLSLFRLKYAHTTSRPIRRQCSFLNFVEIILAVMILHMEPRTEPRWQR